MSALAFELPSALEAREPPEARGLARDGVRLMVGHRSRRDGSSTRGFRDLPDAAAPGDLLVVNVSATLARGRRRPARRRYSGARPFRDARTATRRALARGRAAQRRRLATSARARRRAQLDARQAERCFELVAPYASGARLMLARFERSARPSRIPATRHGEPIRYGYVPSSWPLETYQNVYATAPGSAEMPSAGRPFTPELITRLTAPRRADRADHAARRRVLARAPRAAVPGAASRCPERPPGLSTQRGSGEGA